MSAPVDLVRATLEQAWEAECASDIYLARQVVDLRGLLAEARAREDASERAAKRFYAERNSAREKLREMARVIDGVIAHYHEYDLLDEEWLTETARQLRELAREGGA